MSRSALALLGAGLNSCVLLAAGAGVWLFGPTPLGIGLAAAAGLAGGLVLLLAGRRADRAAARRLAAIGEAAGCPTKPDGDETFYVKTIIASLCRRLERAQAFKAALTATPHPLLMVEEGQIALVSAGLVALDPMLERGQAVPTSYRGKDKLRIGGVDYDVMEHDLGGGRQILSLKRCGAVMARRDLEGLAGALAEGRTGFRFAAESLRQTPELVAINDGMELLDRSVNLIDGLVAGDAEAFAGASGLNSGLGPRVRDIRDTLSYLAEAHADEVQMREGLEHKIAQIKVLLDRHRTLAAQIEDEAARAGDTFSQMGDRLGQGRQNAARLAGLSEEALKIAGSAESAAAVNSAAATEMAGVAERIDRLLAGIEDVSFRTNLVAINAAVEAARAGEKGAGFAVVADEVRQLAQTTTKTAKQIRALTSKGRSDSEAGAEQAQALGETLNQLYGHLRNISNDAEILAGALDEDSRTLPKLGTALAGISGTAGKLRTGPGMAKSG